MLNLQTQHAKTKQCFNEILMTVRKDDTAIWIDSFLSQNYNYKLLQQCVLTWKTCVVKVAKSLTIGNS